jgi:DHA1 family tetracycline resistance protein-like MFS transporter
MNAPERPPETGLDPGVSPPLPEAQTDIQVGTPVKAGRAAVAFIFVTVLLDMMAFGMVAPVLPKLVSEFVRQDAASATLIYTLFNTTFALLQFLFSPLIGALSDRFGRRPLILASNIGLGLNYAFMAWAPNLGWLFLGRAISGVTGASYGTASAYIADTTSMEERAGAFGMLGAAFGVGFMIGPALGGVLGEYFGSRAPFAVAAVFSLLNAGYGVFVLPESLPQALRSRLQFRKANPFGALVLLRRHPDLLALASTQFLSTLAQVSLPTTVVLYVTYRYHWTPFAIGPALTVVGIALAAVQVGVVGRFVRRYGNRAALVTGLCFGATGLYLVGLAPTGIWFWVAAPVIAFWGLAGPAVQTMMTRHVDCSEQGLLQGANASLTGIAELVGPSIFGLTFAHFVAPGHSHAEYGAPFVLAGLLLTATAVFAYVVTRGERDEEGDGEAAVL